MEAIFGSRGSGVRPVGDRIEQLLGGEVETGELLGGEHAHREARRGDGALHEHAVEFQLHHAAERRARLDAECGGQTARATAPSCWAPASGCRRRPVSKIAVTSASAEHAGGDEHLARSPQLTREQQAEADGADAR